MTSSTCSSPAPASPPRPTKETGIQCSACSLKTIEHGCIWLAVRRTRNYRNLRHAYACVPVVLEIAGYAAI